MAYFSEAPNNGWRAQVCRRGQRLTKTFKTRAEAELWASVEEANIMRRADSIKEMLASEFMVSLFPRRVLDALREAPYTHEEIVHGSVDAPNICGVYFLIRGGEVVYVGKSKNVLQRLYKHLNNGKVFDAYNVMHCKPEDLDHYERLYITAMMPIENGSLGLAKPTTLSKDRETA